MSSTSRGDSWRSAPRTLTAKRLQETSKREGIEDTLHLVDVYNKAAATDSPDRDYLQKWLFKYIEWFKKNSSVLEEYIIEDYTKLVHVQPKDHGSKRLLRNFFFSLARSAATTNLDDRCVVHAVYDSLCVLNAKVFSTEEDTTSLLFLAANLLDRMKGPHALTKITYAAYSPVLGAVYQTIATLQVLAPKLLNKTKKDGLYQDFRRRLEFIKQQHEYYPFLFQVIMIEQALERLTSDVEESDFTRIGRRLYSTLTGIMFAFQGLKKLLTVEIEVERFEEAIRRFKEANAKDRISNETWYNCLLMLNESSLLAATDETKLEIFDQCFQCVCETRNSLKSGSQQKQLSYGIVMVLRSLIKIPDIPDAVAEFCVTKLEEIAIPLSVKENWMTDPDIVEALLNSLVEVYFFSIDNEKRLVRIDEEKARHKSVKECLEWMTGMEEGRSMIDAIDCDAHQREAIKQRIAEWFNNESLDDILSKEKKASPYESTTQEDLFSIVKQEMGITHSSKDEVLKTISDLKGKYQSLDFKQVRPFLAKAEVKCVSAFEHSLVRCEENVDTVYAMNDDGDMEEDQVATNFNRQNKSNPSITLNEVFSPPRNQADGKVMEVNTVLVFGNPGTGKTTISKKIAYEWAKGRWMPELSTVYWLAVREISDRLYDNTALRKQKALECAIANLCFGYKEEYPYRVLLAQIANDLNESATLVILDGVDEADDTGKMIIKSAFEHRCKVLLFSRPYELRDELTAVNVEIECVGLNDVQLENFVRSEVQGQSGTDLLEFLKSNPSIWNIAHIPMNLNILCFVWKEKRHELTRAGAGRGLMSLYTEMSLYLWQRYRVKQPSDDSNREDAFIVLERVAFRGLRNGQILIQQNVVEQFTSTSMLRRNIRDSGFLLLQTTSTTQYQFPHLTFQEFFAGSYLARTLRARRLDSERERTEQFISEIKYQPKHKLTFTFLAQKLGQQDGIIAFSEMLKLVDAEPLEMVGVQQVFLKLRILDDFLSSAEQPQWEKYENNKEATRLVEIMFQLLRVFRGNPNLLEMVISRLEPLSSVIRYASANMRKWLDEVKETGPKSKKELDLMEKFLMHHDMRSVVVGEMREKWRKTKAESSRTDATHGVDLSRRGALCDLLIRYNQEEDNRMVPQICEKLIETAMTLKETSGGHRVSVLSHSARSNGDVLRFPLKKMKKLLHNVEAFLEKKFSFLYATPEIEKHHLQREKWKNMNLNAADRVPSQYLVDDMYPQFTQAQETTLHSLKKGSIFLEQYLIVEEPESEESCIRVAEQTYSGEKVWLKFYKSLNLYGHAKEFYRILEGSDSVCRMLAAEDAKPDSPACIVLQRGNHTLPAWLMSSDRTSHDLKCALTEILAALADIHRQDVVHCNLKPENIMMFPNFKWKLVGLDYAVLSDQKPREKDLNTYMAPEVIGARAKDDDEFKITPAADMWSFGLIAYEILTGKPFFNSNVKCEDIAEKFQTQDSLPTIDITNFLHATRLIGEILQIDPEKRLTATGAAENLFFQNPEHTIVIKDKKNGSNKSKPTRPANSRPPTAEDQYKRGDENVARRKHLVYGTGSSSGETVVLRFYKTEEDYEKAKQRHRAFSSSEHICKYSSFSWQWKSFEICMDDFRKLLSVDASGKGQPYSVFQNGVSTLSEWSRGANRSFSEKKNALLQILTGLVDIHDADLVHCRLNPEKVMIFPDYKWKFLDVSAFVKSETVWPINVDIMYAAPEIVKALEEGKTAILADKASDMWSFGVIAYEVFTGKRFYGEEADGETVKRCVASGKLKPDYQLIDQKQTRSLLKKLLVMDPKERRTATRASQSSCFQVVESTTQVSSTTQPKLSSYQNFAIMRLGDFAHANIIISYCLENFLSEKDASESFAEREGVDAFVLRDDDLPDDPVFVLSVKEDCRLRIAIAGKSALIPIQAISSVKVSLSHNQEQTLELVEMPTNGREIEVVALLKPSSLGDVKLQRPSPEHGEWHVKYVQLNVTVSMRVTGNRSSVERLKQKIYIKMVEPGTFPSGKKFEREFTDAWDRLQAWKEEGKNKSILLVKA